MKIDDKIAPLVNEHTLTAHQKALDSILHERKFTFIIPIHTSNMAIRQPGGLTKIQKTIIPEIAIYYNDNLISKTETGDVYINKSGIGYRITYNNSAIPLAHVYNKSGYLCLGNIFVPSQIPIHAPMQPLETLFLHNDRYVAHGHPKLPMTQTVKINIETYLLRIFPNLSHAPFDTLEPDWIKKDTLWSIGAYLLENLPYDEAISHMEKIFKHVFKVKKGVIT